MAEGMQEVQLGGETVSAREDYLKVITNLLYKVNGAAEGKSLGDLQWSLNFYTDILISSILKPELGTL